jgi:hypothetical protein
MPDDSRRFLMMREFVGHNAENRIQLTRLHGSRSIEINRDLFGADARISETE